MKDFKLSLEDLKLAVRSAGLRATPARLAVLRTLHAAEAPMTHAEVSKLLAADGIDTATVFRNLNGLAQVGLVRRVELGDHDDSHPHFLCVDCGSVTCLSEVRLTSSSQRETASVGEVTEILVRGRCNDCR